MRVHYSVSPSELVISKFTIEIRDHKQQFVQGIEIGPTNRNFVEHIVQLLNQDQARREATKQNE